ncbi:hypothetical protein ABWH96_14535 [Marivirga tractuosa]|uniref:hypothetical protein n=1 Tax=Marivirga tractuosa TaxID=1006 RepID=UPI0035CF09FE
MKNIIRIVWFLCFCLSINACHQESTIMVTRIINNQTDKPVEINIWVSNNLFEKIKIAENSADTLKSICDIERGQVQNCNPVARWSEGADSVQVIFENESVLTYCISDTYCREINKKNIMDFNIFNTPGVANNGYEEIEDKVFVFTIEESDYELANKF